MVDNQSTGFLSRWFYFVLVIIMIKVIFLFLIYNNFATYVIVTVIILSGIAYVLLGLSKIKRNYVSDWSIILGIIGYISAIIVSYIGDNLSGGFGFGSGGLALLPLIALFFISVIISLILLIVNIIQHLSKNFYIGRIK